MQVAREIEKLKLSTSHFFGKGWLKGRKRPYKNWNELPLRDILTEGSTFQSFKLKKRLFAESIKCPRCEMCGWNQTSSDGRIPVELDHINGDKTDNRIQNLRILCPNCHSLQPTHRGRNKKLGWRNGRRQTLKMS